MELGRRVSYRMNERWAVYRQMAFWVSFFGRCEALIALLDEVLILLVDVLYVDVRVVSSSVLVPNNEEFREFREQRTAKKKLAGGARAYGSREARDTHSSLIVAQHCCGAVMRSGACPPSTSQSTTVAPHTQMRLLMAHSRRSSSASSICPTLFVSPLVLIFVPCILLFPLGIASVTAAVPSFRHDCSDQAHKVRFILHNFLKTLPVK
ncbi:unnamed protein product [Toxocara canis]|uniref:Transmembrane protein n=1 Tax=Toxocara canis TaxID=6265 RepID=A0A183VFY5_TOXCA|nr:unnamed protein product [Toxocara canis]